MKRNRRVKVVATLGPASNTSQTIARLFEAGADVFRVNMSHTPQDELERLHGIIRKIEDRTGRPIAILVDLQGPKFRMGTFRDDRVELRDGETFRLDGNETPGDRKRVHLPHPEIFESIEPGHRMLLNDGRQELLVTKVAATTVDTTVVHGGELSNRKGVSLPDTVLPVTPLTPKDRSDLEFALNLGVDWIALSFVQRPDDIAECRKLTDGRAAIMSKIEKPAALNNLDEIIELSDAVMVARGDLGVELPIERVPGLQKRMTRAARRTGTPVVVATQMLESMIEAPTPTRAEVSDVSIAVFEGADAIMLSAESAMGAYPDRAVEMMDKIAREVEQDPNYMRIIHAQRTRPEPTTADAISAAARATAETLDLAAIVCYTATGSTGLRAARERPETPIIALTPMATAGRKLALVWGIHCVLTADAHDQDDMIDRAARISMEEGFAEPNQRIAIMAGLPLGTPGATNMLRIAHATTPNG